MIVKSLKTLKRCPYPENLMVGYLEFKEEIVLNEDQIEGYHYVLSQIPEMLRKFIIARYQDGMTYEEIDTVLGKYRNWTSQHIHRSIEEPLQKILEESRGWIVYGYDTYRKRKGMLDDAEKLFEQKSLQEFQRGNTGVRLEDLPILSCELRSVLWDLNLKTVESLKERLCCQEKINLSTYGTFYTNKIFLWKPEIRKEFLEFIFQYEMVPEDAICYSMYRKEWESSKRKFQRDEKPIDLILDIKEMV